jgi:hypothetical protein
MAFGDPILLYVCELLEEIAESFSYTSTFGPHQLMAFGRPFKWSAKKRGKWGVEEEGAREE